MTVEDHKDSSDPKNVATISIFDFYRMKSNISNVSICFNYVISKIRFRETTQIIKYNKQIQKGESNNSSKFSYEALSVNINNFTEHELEKKGSVTQSNVTNGINAGTIINQSFSTKNTEISYNSGIPISNDKKQENELNKTINDFLLSKFIENTGLLKNSSFTFIYFLKKIEQKQKPRICNIKSHLIGIDKKETLDRNSLSIHNRASCNSLKGLIKNLEAKLIHKSINFNYIIRYLRSKIKFCKIKTTNESFSNNMNETNSSSIESSTNKTFGGVKNKQIDIKNSELQNITVEIYKKINETKTSYSNETDIVQYENLNNDTETTVVESVLKPENSSSKNFTVEETLKINETNSSKKLAVDILKNKIGDEINPTDISKEKISTKSSSIEETTTKQYSDVSASEKIGIEVSIGQNFTIQESLKINETSSNNIELNEVSNINKDTSSAETLTNNDNKRIQNIKGEENFKLSETNMIKIEPSVNINVKIIINDNNTSAVVIEQLRKNVTIAEKVTIEESINVASTSNIDSSAKITQNEAGPIIINDSLSTQNITKEETSKVNEANTTKPVKNFKTTPIPLSKVQDNKLEKKDSKSNNIPELLINSTVKSVHLVKTEKVKKPINLEPVKCSQKFQAGFNS